MPRKRKTLKCSKSDEPPRYLGIGLRCAHLQRYLELYARKVAIGPPSRRPLSKFGVLAERVVSEDTFRLQPTHDVDIWNMGSYDPKDSAFAKMRARRKKAKRKQAE